jgi:hypothetical protein
MVIQIRSIPTKERASCELRPARPDPPNAEFTQPADPERLERTAEALQGRGFRAHVAADGVAAKQFVLDAIPEGAEVHTALS